MKWNLLFFVLFELTAFTTVLCNAVKNKTGPLLLS